MITTKYKQTELGMIPEDWEVDKLDNYCDKIGSGITPTGGNNVYLKHGRPFVRSQNVGWGNLILDDIAFINDDIHNTFPNTELKLNDVLLNISGASIGRSSYVTEKLIGGNVNQHVCVIRAKPKLNHFFLNKFLLSKQGQLQIDNCQSGGNRQGLNIGQIRIFNIPIPPLTEQTAIANALSEMDALIDGLEELIAKKKNLKQGALQKLLKPKEGWVKRKLGEVAWFQEGPGLRNWQFTKSGIKVINVTNLENGKINLDRTDRHISIEEFNKVYKHFEINANDIVVASSGNTYGKVAVVTSDKLPLLMNTSVIRFKPTDKITFKFLLIFLNSKSFKDQIDNMITGGAQPNFGPYHLKKVNIDLPHDSHHQNLISDIIFDMDNEIEILQIKLSKYKQLKQGMMQNLLTGKIRLV